MLTAYDASIARIIDEQEVEVVLVGDSLGMVVQGRPNTALVTLADMEYHTSIVRRGVKKALLMADIPMGCALDARVATESALGLMRAGADLVKFEVYPNMLPILRHLNHQGIPFCAHLGLLPQQVIKEGGYKIKGRKDAEAKEMLKLAQEVESSGADMILLECVASSLAETITEKSKLPVVGIGSGGSTDAQVLVVYDMLGFNPKPPRFVKNFMTGADSIAAAISSFRREVLGGGFPAAEHSYKD